MQVLIKIKNDEKLVFLFIAGCGLGLASCGGTSASDNSDIVVEDTLDKDSIAEPKNADGESVQLKEEEPIKEDDKITGKEGIGSFFVFNKVQQMLGFFL